MASLTPTIGAPSRIYTTMRRRWRYLPGDLADIAALQRALQLSFLQTQRNLQLKFVNFSQREDAQEDANKRSRLGFLTTAQLNFLQQNDSTNVDVNASVIADVDTSASASINTRIYANASI
jgi:hypothetical protein